MEYCSAVIYVALHQLPAYICRISGSRAAATIARNRHGSGAGRDPQMPINPPGQRMTTMPEATEYETATSSKKSKPAATPGASSFEMPKFPLPNFDVPKMEIPAAFREIAEKSVSQAKETYERMKTAAEEATDVIEDTYATASKGASEYGLKLIEASRENANAAFDYASELVTAKSVSEVIELSTAHLRKQFDAYSTQAKELAALAQKIATESAEPIKEGVTKAFKKVA
jgi:phasin